MTQSLADVLSNRPYAEPPDIQLIKSFVEQEIAIIPQVAVNNDTYIVTVNSAAAAGALRGSIYRLQIQLEKGKRVIVRIS